MDTFFYFSSFSNFISQKSLKLCTSIFLTIQCLNIFLDKVKKKLVVNQVSNFQYY